MALAQRWVGDWVMVQVHPWTSIYVWKTTPLYNQFGETVGRLDANTIYLNLYSTCPEEDLFHEFGHAFARKFDLISHRGKGFLGHWELRQFRLVGSVRHQWHWSRLLDRVRAGAPPCTPDLTSEIWAELFMCWYLYPTRQEITFIEPEMAQLEPEPVMQSIDKLAKLIMN